MSSFNKILLFCFLFLKLLINPVFGDDSSSDFNNWLSSYKKFALKKGISKKTIDLAFKDVKFLAQVIKYDRKQPEFYEDTITYVSKRANSTRLKKGVKLFYKNESLFLEVENKFQVEKNANSSRLDGIFPLLNKIYSVYDKLIKPDVHHRW